MTAARCPLVREIEEAAASCPHGPGTHPTAAQVDAYFIVVDNVFYDRIRAALEAAEEMAENIGKVTDSPGLWMAAKRYRAATRTERTK
jgi:hypothetical protein